MSDWWRTDVDAVNFAGRSLLAVFAHPDDESIACGGLLALCADRGARVELVCATHGENRGGRRDEVWYEQRARELDAAARILGIAEVVLLDYRDGFLPWASDLSDRLEEEIRRRRPDVVVTFGKDGLYWHPDHIAICDATTAAVDAMGDAAPALYYVTMPPGQLRRVLDETGDDPGTTTPVLGVANPDAFGVGATLPTLVVDITTSAPRKLAALKCHRSQIDGSVFARIPDAEAGRFFDVEHYHRPPGSRIRSRHAFLDLLETGSGVN